MKLFGRFLMALTIGAALSCDSSDEAVPDTALDYIPLSVGGYQVYDVEETIYTLGTPSTSYYQLKVSVVDKFLGDSGDSVFVLYRYKAPPGTSEWTYHDTWSARRTANEAVVSEANTPFIKLKFPAAQGRRWNGNAYNNLGEDEYLLEAVNESHEVKGQIYTDCITVRQSDNDDYVVFLDQRHEIYARHAGLVYKEVTQLHYCTQPACLGKQQVESGQVLKQSLTTYGNEMYGGD